jgi:hypothetical protein
MIYFGSGGVQIGGCGLYDSKVKYPYKYKPGTIVYYQPKAKVGKLEKIVIQKVHVVKSIPNDGFLKVLYYDTYKSLYNEYDLIFEDEALLLAKKYYEKQLKFARDAMYNCKKW